MEQQQQDDRFLRLHQIIGDAKKGIVGLIPISKSAWYAGIKAGRYPKPINLGARTVAWKLSDIQALCKKLGGGK